MATCDTLHQMELTFQNALLAEPLIKALPIPNKLWRVLHAVAIWEIWKAQSQHYMADIRTTSWGVIRKIWTRLCLYLKHFWSLKMRKIKLRKISRSKAKREMRKEFGNHIAIWNVRGNTFRVSSAPPRPH
jgi:hypothetical protein